MWKVENVANVLGDRVKEISSQAVESAFWIFAVAFSKIARRERCWEEEKKKKSGLAGFEDSQPLHVAPDVKK